jgi:uncharacterized protein YlxW (UPF0749 family)
MKIHNLNVPKGHISLAFVLVILGLLLSTSFSTHQQLGNNTTDLRKKGLIEVVKDLENDRDVLKDQLQILNKRIGKFEKKAASEEGILASFTTELESQKLAAGFWPVTGPGVEVTLGDSLQIPTGKDPNNYIIHDYDLRVVVNALWAGGAEAISINGQRLISTSSIRCAGNTILVNYTRLASPYKIKAIGNPSKLIGSLNNNYEVKPLFKGYAKALALRFDIEELSNQRIPAYVGRLGIEYARATETED